MLPPLPAGAGGSWARRYFARASGRHIQHWARAMDAPGMPGGTEQAQGATPPSAVFVLVSSGRGGEKSRAQPAAGVEQPRSAQQGQFIVSGSTAGAAAPAAGQLPSPLPPNPRSVWLLRALALAGALAAIAGVTLLVLWKVGALSGGGEDDWQPLPYAQRQRAAAAVPAFSAELHPWLLPSEQAAIEEQLDTDVIIVGAGVAGLKAAQTLAGRMRVTVLEARVSGHGALRACLLLCGLCRSSRSAACSSKSRPFGLHMQHPPAPLPCRCRAGWAAACGRCRLQAAQQSWVPSSSGGLAATSTAARAAKATQ